MKSLAKQFQVTETPTVEARYNIAPTQNILTVQETPDRREMKWFKWGLVPSWAKDASMDARLINACSKTVTEKPASATRLSAGAALFLRMVSMSGSAWKVRSSPSSSS